MAANLVTFIRLFFATQCSLDIRNSYQDNYSPYLKNSETFDFIVVGAGTAGSVVAGRLSENPKWKVLLLEAGNFPAPETQVPQIFMSHVETELDWNYRLESCSHACLGYVGQQCTLGRGKTIGGTGTINGMVYVRGIKEDYDNWERLGNSGWNWESVLPYFNRAENVHNRTGKYGFDGPLPLIHIEANHEIRDVLINSSSEIGFGLNHDERDFGLFEYLYNIDNGERCSTAEAYISRNRYRKNLYIAAGAHVKKVIIKNNAAVGVEIDVDGRRLSIKSKKEVILSAGTVGSSQLLMLSGIGPKKHLDDLEIPVVKDLSVGKNFHDHVAILGLFMKLEFPKDVGFDILYEALKYSINRTGYYSMEYTTNMFLSVSTKDDPNVPNLHFQFIFLPKNTEGIYEAFRKMGMKPEIARSIAEYNKIYNLFNPLPFVGVPRSRGEVLLKSKNPYEHPSINPNILSDPEEYDVSILKDSFRFIRKLMKTPTMQKHKAEWLRVNITGCNHLDFETDEYAICHIKHLTNTFFHCVGTCKMGPNTDENAVVDDRLKVHGVKNIRVIDASIIPVVPSRNINAPIIMIAEKGADMIRRDVNNSD